MKFFLFRLLVNIIGVECGWFCWCVLWSIFRVGNVVWLMVLWRLCWKFFIVLVKDILVCIWYFSSNRVVKLVIILLICGLLVC